MQINFNTLKGFDCKKSNDCINGGHERFENSEIYKASLVNSTTGELNVKVKTKNRSFNFI